MKKTSIADCDVERLLSSLFGPSLQVYSSLSWTRMVPVDLKIVLLMRRIPSWTSSPGVGQRGSRYKVDSACIALVSWTDRTHHNKAAGSRARRSRGIVKLTGCRGTSRGEQVAQLWPILFTRANLEIAFAHRTFAWGSDARGKAHVHVVILSDVGRPCRLDESIR